MKKITVLVTDEAANRLARCLAEHHQGWPIVEVRRLIEVIDMPEPRVEDEVITITEDSYA
jgi:hypothetical protein